MANFTIKTSTGRNNVVGYVVGYELDPYPRFRRQYFEFTVPTTVPGTSIPVTSAKIIGGTLSGTLFNYTIGSGNSSEDNWDNFLFYYTVRNSAGSFDSTPPTENEAIGTVNFYKLADSYNPDIDFWNKSPTLTKTRDYSLTPGNTYTIGFYTVRTDYMWRWWTDTPFDLVIEYESYTKCSPPTSITLTPTIQKHGSDITINWSGAKGGSSNTIAKYGIQYKIGNGSWTETKYVTSSATSGSYSFTIPSTATQGANIRAAVKTIGAVSGYDSDWGYSSTTAGKVNTIPGTPTINFSGQILPSSGRGITLDIVDTGVDPDGQSVTLKYKRGENGSLESLSNATVLTEIGTYYFYSKDSLDEYSEPLTWKVTGKNSKPLVSIGQTGTEAVNYGPSSPDPISYIYNPTFTFTTSGGQNNNNKYTCKLYTGASRDSLSLKETLLQNSSNSRIAFTDIRDKIGTDVYYKIEVTRNDGVEESDVVSSETYFIPSPAGIENISNKIKVETETTVNKFLKYFSSGIQPYLYKDTGYNQLEVSIDGTYYSSFNLINEENNLFFSQISNIAEDRFPRGSTKTFQFSLYNSATRYKKFIAEREFTRIKYIEDFKENAELTWEDEIVTNPFKSSEGIISFLNIFKNKPLKDYGFSEAPQYIVKATYDFSSSEPVKPSADQIDYEENDRVKISLNGGQIFNLYHDIGMNKNLDVVYSTILSISFESVFGDVYEASVVKQIEWSTSPELELKIFTIGGLSESSFIKEGMKIDGTLTIKSYHGNLRDIKIEGKKNETVFYSTTIIPRIDFFEPASQEIVSVEYSLSGLDLKIGEQPIDLTGGNVEFKITGTNKLEKSATITQIFTGPEGEECKVFRHVPGQIKISSASYNNNTIKYSFKFSDLGMNSTLEGYSKIAEIKIIVDEDFDNPEIITDADFNTSSQEKTLPRDLNDQWQFLKLQIQGIITSYTNTNKTNSPSSKTFYSNEYIIYNASPTISYRKNQIGINVNLSNINDKNDAIIVIGGHSGKNMIYFGPDLAGTININDGTISGFIIDGGSWDDEI